MAIMTPRNLLKDIDNALKSLIIFDEIITISTDNGNVMLINKIKYDYIMKTVNLLPKI